MGCLIHIPPFTCRRLQARLQSERQRLASHRILDDHPLAVATAEASGQRVGRSTTLEELLKRPHFRYTWVMWGWREARDSGAVVTWQGLFRSQ